MLNPAVRKALRKCVEDAEIAANEYSIRVPVQIDSKKSLVTYSKLYGYIKIHDVDDVTKESVKVNVGTEIDSIYVSDTHIYALTEKENLGSFLSKADINDVSALEAIGDESNSLFLKEEYGYTLSKLYGKYILLIDTLTDDGYFMVYDSDKESIVYKDRCGYKIKTILYNNNTLTAVATTNCHDDCTSSYIFSPNLWDDETLHKPVYTR